MPHFQLIGFPENDPAKAPSLAKLEELSSRLSLSPDKTYTVFPGFCDVHVHFREPGFSYKETIATGAHAAARGGYTAVCAMPNLDPVPDSLEHLQPEMERIRETACIHVYPYGAITVGQLGEKMAALEEMAPYVCGFSDDGHGVQNRAMMRDAMIESKKLGKLIVAHCEDNSLVRGGCIHDGEYARIHGHKGICSESEWGPIARDAELAAETGCGYHVCHVSCRESVEIIRSAKKKGINISCETAPHYLLMDDSMLEEDGRFKMNPPIRSRDDQAALIEGLLDGTIDALITDHAPHSAEEKAKGLEGSAFGIVGIETAFPLLYTGLVKTGIVPLEKIISLLTESPRRRFDLPIGEDYCIWDLEEEYTIDPAEYLSKGKSSPFNGWTVSGRCIATVCGGRIAYQR